SEIPLAVLHEFAAPPSAEEAKYRSYGIAISKKAVFDAGGRPVIYLPDAEGDWIPSDQKWRHVRYEHGRVDFTHEREWRVAGNLDLTKLPGIFVIVWSLEEVKLLGNFKTKVDDKIRGILPMEHLGMMV